MEEREAGTGREERKRGRDRHIDKEREAAEAESGSEREGNTGETIEGQRQTQWKSQRQGG